jgi:hypothetical protein
MLGEELERQALGLGLGKLRRAHPVYEPRLAVRALVP